MKLVFFSGNSLRNRDFAFEAEAKLKDMFDATYIQGYKHWQTGQEWIDLPHEIEVLKSSNQTGEYGVIAKSIGTVLAVQAITQGIIKPKFLLLLGVPLGYMTKDYPEFGQALLDINLPTVIIQNDNDPVGTAQNVLAYLPEPLHKMLITSKGTTHDYEDYPLLREQLKILSKGV